MTPLLFPRFALHEVNLAVPVKVSQFSDARAHWMEVPKQIRQGLTGGNSILPFEATSILTSKTNARIYLGSGQGVFYYIFLFK